MKLIDLSKFEKVAEDKHTATMKHKDGHTMTILKKALPAIQREQLKHLKMAKGGKIRKMYSDSDQPVSQDDNAPTTDDSGQAPVTVNVNTPAPQASPIPPALQANPAPVDRTPQSDGWTPPAVAQPSAPPVQSGNTDANSNLQGRAYAQNVQADQQRQQIQDAAMAKYDEQVQHTIDAINNNKIDPKHYQQSQSGAQKFSTGIGLMLGGLSVPFGGKNFAQEHLESQINRDIDAQKTNLESQKSILGAYHQLFGDKVLSYNATRQNMNSAAENRVKAAALGIGTPQAMNNAAAFSQGVQAQNAQLRAASGQRIKDLANGAPKEPITSNTPPPSQTPPYQPPPAGTLPNGLTPDQQMKNNAAKAAGFVPPFPETSNSSASKAAVEPSNPIQPILDADAKARLVQFNNNPNNAAIAREVNEAFSKSTNLDNNLGKIRGSFKDLSDSAESGGRFGYYHRHPIDLSAPGAAIGGLTGAGLSVAGMIPTIGTSAFALPGATGAGVGVGTAAGKAVNSVESNITDTQQVRDYARARADLYGFVKSALPSGTADSAVQELVDSFAPEFGDTPKMLESKYRGLIEKLQTVAGKGLLQGNGIIHKD